MLTPRAGIDPEFFQCLRKFDTGDALVSAAISYARVCADLLNRILTARSAARGEIHNTIPGIQLALFLEYVEHGPAAFSSGIGSLPPAELDPVQLQQLADTAHWLAGRFSLARLEDSSYQVWLSPDARARIRIFGKPSETPPPEFLRLDSRQPALDWLAGTLHRPACVLGHYDVHGISMLALTRRFLLSHGAGELDCSFNFESTGDISKLWKRVIPRAIASEREYGSIVMVDCSVHSRRPEYTRSAIERLDRTPDTRLFIVDHHPDTLLQSADLFHPQVQVVLTDILSCGFVDRWDAHNLDLMYLGALGDKVPEIALSRPQAEHPALYAANEQYHAWMINYSPTPKEYKDEREQPLRALWEGLSQDAALGPELSTQLLGRELPVGTDETVETRSVGGILLVTSRPPSVGRTWYALLEGLMEAQGLSYALAMRVLGENRANLLLLTHWTAIDRAPVRLFIPERYQGNCIGHPGAVWVDLERQQALDFIRSTVDNLNGFYGTEADSAPALEQIRRNILYPEAHV